MDVEAARGLPEPVVHAGLDGESAKDLMVREAGSLDVAVDRLPPHGDGRDFEDRVLALAGHVVRHLAEGALVLAHAGQHAAFDHDLGVGGNFHVDGAPRGDTATVSGLLLRRRCSFGQTGK